MAIAFNIPSEREPEENFSRLNRLLAELYDVLCHILVSRQPEPEPRRERPFSDSDIERPTFSGLPEISNQLTTRPRPLSASALMPILNLDFNDLEDDVFVSPRTDQGNDPFSDPRNMEIFGNPRNGSPRTPAGVLLSPRRERRFTFTGNEKHWRDKGGTDEADGFRVGRSRNNTISDETDTSSEPSTSRSSSSSEGSILSSILPDKISGSICTAVLFVLGWKLLTTKR